ncbi:MAG: isochorismatase family protein [Deltaproteobacteria bacterium]|nr:isochorismatase family protein [Deltaproteobacteria bacterium]
MRVLLVIDEINDFGPDGALPVPEGEKVVPVTNELLEHGKFDLRVNVCEKHKPGNVSFASRYPGLKPFETHVVNGKVYTVWPDHSLENTWGADPLPGLRVDLLDRTVVKGADVEVHSYSGFIDDTRTVNTELETLLLAEAQSRGEGREDIELFVCGLATDYCAGITALDGANLGFKVALVLDACRAIAPETELKMLRDLAAAGVRVIESREVCESRELSVPQVRERTQELRA